VPYYLDMSNTEVGQYEKSIWSPSPNFNWGRKGNKVSTIVIHITDGQEKLDRAVEHLQKKENQVSAHFIIGRDGTIVQLVKIENIAWHAAGANNISVGIEHIARSPGELSITDEGLPVTDAQYRSSADLVKWLCGKLDLPINRDHIKGHCELVDKNGKFISSHRDCPNRIWDWNKYMDLLTASPHQTVI